MPGDKIAVLQGLDGYIIVESNGTMEEVFSFAGVKTNSRSGSL
jgi:hypothetical protein